VAAERGSLPADAVVGLEHTRATTLHFNAATRAAIGAGLRSVLDGRADIGLERRTRLTMARRR
jgi:hypothetical protein